MKQISVIKILILGFIVWNVFLQIDVNNLKKQLETSEPSETIVLEQLQDIQLEEIKYE